MPQVAKLAPLGSHMFYVGLYRENLEKIFLSETTGPRVLIFGMLHYLVNLYQVCLNYMPGAKIWPTPEYRVFHRLIWGNIFKKSSCLKL